MGVDFRPITDKDERMYIDYRHSIFIQIDKYAYIHIMYLYMYIYIVYEPTCAHIR